VVVHASGFIAQAAQGTPRMTTRAVVMGGGSFREGQLDGQHPGDRGRLSRHVACRASNNQACEDSAPVEGGDETVGIAQSKRFAQFHRTSHLRSGGKEHDGAALDGDVRER
jgi:hypothetical protein